MTLIKSTAAVPSCYACHLSVLSEWRSRPITHHSVGRLLSAALVTLWFLEPIRALIEHLFGLWKHHWRTAWSCSFCSFLTVKHLSWSGTVGLSTGAASRHNKGAINWEFIVIFHKYCGEMISNHCPLTLKTLWSMLETLWSGRLWCRGPLSIILWNKFLCLRGNGLKYKKPKGSDLGWVIKRAFPKLFLSCFALSVCIKISMWNCGQYVQCIKLLVYDFSLKVLCNFFTGL